LLRCVELLEDGRAEVDNVYLRAVRERGNEPAQELIQQIFEVVDRKWRGVGEISSSGLALREQYAEYDAERRHDVGELTAEESSQCIAGLVLQGAKKPHECPAFGNDCTPERPLGAPMVSAEGACSAYYRYRKLS
jgi:hydrogenase expression/formation protein HypD